MKKAASGKAAGRGPLAGGGIIQFRALECSSAVITAHDQHFAVRQERGSMQIAGCAKSGGVCPRPAGRIIEFRAAQREGRSARPPPAPFR